MVGRATFSLSDSLLMSILLAYEHTRDMDVLV